MVILPSTSVAVKVIEPPLAEVDSVIAKIPAALIVTALAVEVVLNKVEDVPLPAPTPNTPSLETLPSTSVAVNVITLPTSEIVFIPAAVIVTPVCPLVLEFIIEVVPVPAATVREPSLLILPSISVPVIVIASPTTETTFIPAPVIEASEASLDKSKVAVVVPVTEMVCNSLVIEPSTSVLVNVKSLPLLVTVVIPAPVNVASVASLPKSNVKG